MFTCLFCRRVVLMWDINKRMNQSFQRSLYSQKKSANLDLAFQSISSEILYGALFSFLKKMTDYFCLCLFKSLIVCFFLFCFFQFNAFLFLFSFCISFLFFVIFLNFIIRLLIFQLLSYILYLPFQSSFLLSNFVFRCIAFIFNFKHFQTFFSF